MPTLPMFPLGSVLFPGVVIPLHIFEPRYRELTRFCLDGDREFGVVLIERGSEVGGEDVRSDVGTVARIVEAVEAPDGRWTLAVLGTRRLRVRQWLPDAPYPRAEIDWWPDEDEGRAARGTWPDGEVSRTLDETIALLRKVLALRTELGDGVAPATTSIAVDDVIATIYRIAVLSPLGPLDLQRLLAIPNADARLTSLVRSLEGELEVAQARMFALPPDPG